MTQPGIEPRSPGEHCTHKANELVKIYIYIYIYKKDELGIIQFDNI